MGMKPDERPSDDAMYEALLRRDAECDGVFFVGVKTTGIFCRPTCSARKPKRMNVEFFYRPGDALHAGYRPCKVCHPMDAGLVVLAWVERLKARIEQNPGVRLTDADLRAMHIVPSTARSFFKKRYGMTFHAYARARRLGGALGAIRQGQSAQRAGYANGFESASGFQDAFAKMFGTPIGRGRSLSLLKADWINTPLGAMVAVADDAGLRLLEFVDRRAIEKQVGRIRRRLAGAIVPGPHAILNQIRRELEAYFDGRSVRFRTPLAPVGSDFQLAVWRRLREIPAGQTKSYAELAEALDRPGASRAIGRANGTNAIAIVIPCHRVIASDGSLCGYGGGMWRKRWLLDHERTITASRGEPVAASARCAG